MKETFDSMLDRPPRTVTAGALHKGITRSVFGGKSRGFSVKEFATRYQISHEELTRMTGFSLRAVSNWSQGSKPSSSTARRLTEVKRLFAALESLVSREAIG